ncbi:MAG: substrate-binding domain-containing protein [Bacteroidota bacterium]
MKKNFLSLVLIIVAFFLKAQDHRYDPPWNIPPQSKVMFTVPGIDNVPDLFGDINDPQLVIFFAGNQFMCIDDLIATFKKIHPEYQRIFAETLPPGILAKQIQGGSLTIGNLRITLKPDIYTAGKNVIDEMKEQFTDTVTYAYNKLAIMVRKGNPENIKGLKDLGRTGIRISMPNPAWEGVAKQIQEGYVKAGGENLRQTIMVSKINDSTTYLTQIHHRETPMRIMYNLSDAGPVWYSEAFYQRMIGNPIDMVTIPDAENATAIYKAGLLKTAPHPKAAKDFIIFLGSQEAKDIYKKYGFDVSR